MREARKPTLSVLGIRTSIPVRWCFNLASPGEVGEQVSTPPLLCLALVGGAGYSVAGELIESLLYDSTCSIS